VWTSGPDQGFYPSPGVDAVWTKVWTGVWTSPSGTLLEECVMRPKPPKGWVGVDQAHTSGLEVWTSRGLFTSPLEAVGGTSKPARNPPLERTRRCGPPWRHGTL
jgi:hypothetical protein